MSGLRAMGPRVWGKEKAVDGSAPLAEAASRKRLPWKLEVTGRKRGLEVTGEKTCEGLCCEQRQPKACFSC